MKRLISGMLALGLALTLSFPAAALDSQETLELLELYYVNDIPPEVYQLDSPEEILEALGDPYTEYLSAQRYAAFMSSVNGQSLVGLGVIVQQEEDGSLRIREVLPDSPAQVAGLEANDRILSIDGVKITAETNYLAMLAGEEDTSVILSVQREGETADYVVIRGAVSVPIVASELVDGVPVIECVSFGDSTAEAFYRALVEYADQPGAWVVDLRSNGGGSVEASVGAADWFVG